MKRIAIQGVKGCFHEQAARLFYEEHGHVVPEIVECLTFDDLYKNLIFLASNVVLLCGICHMQMKPT